jgi:hypothetical protein
MEEDGWMYELKAFCIEILTRIEGILRRNLDTRCDAHAR